MFFCVFFFFFLMGRFCSEMPAFSLIYMKNFPLRMKSHSLEDCPSPCSVSNTENCIGKSVCRDLIQLLLPDLAFWQVRESWFTLLGYSHILLQRQFLQSTFKISLIVMFLLVIFLLLLIVFVVVFVVVLFVCLFFQKWCKIFNLNDSAVKDSNMETNYLNCDLKIDTRDNYCEQLFWTGSHRQNKSSLILFLFLEEL